MNDVSASTAPVKRRRVRRLLLTLLLLMLAAAGYLLLARSPIDAVAFVPSPAPAMTGALAPNAFLQTARPLGQGQLLGPEDVDVDAQGRIYGGTLDGWIVRSTDNSGTRFEPWARTGGRPLGIDFDAAGNLVVADADRGLLSIDLQSQVTVLATAAEGLHFGFTDDVAVAADGAIYFSDASSKYDNDDYLYDMLEARPHGRLLKYDPQTGQTTVLLDGLYFANGVALSQREEFVLVNETYRYRITRYWLTGPRTGQSEVFVDNLPGFPDGVSSSGGGTFWVAMFTVRNDTADWMHPRPGLKNVLAKLPRFVWPKPERYGFVLAVDEQGEIVRSLQDPTGEKVWEVTSVHERDGDLYLGTLTGDRINRVTLP